LTALSVYKGNRSKTEMPRRMRRDASPQARARNYVLRALARSDHPRAALARKLRERGFPKAVVRRVLDECVRQKLLDDRRFAARYVHAALTLRGYAPARIRRELLLKGIPASVASLALESVDDEAEAEALRRAVARRVRTLAPPRTPEARRRWIAYLRRMGFRPLRIREALDTIEK
jgi:regulatory protein